jgi:hypothetical protein
VVHTDGEFFCRPEDDVRRLEVALVPTALRVLARRPVGQAGSVSHGAATRQARSA